MELGTVLLIIGSLVGISAVFALIAISALGSRRKNRVRDLVSGVLASSNSGTLGVQSGRKRPTSVEDIEELKRKSREARNSKDPQITAILTRPSSKKEATKTITTEKYFRAGIYTQDDRRFFERFQIVSPIICTMLGAGFMALISSTPHMIVVGVVLGLFIGISIPKSWLERQIRSREDEVLFYLPLVIEQISIGVSSSLDLWPCITNILQMARERDTHNPVTELFLYVEKLITSGLNFQDALQEVGQASGIQQIKHTFKFLAQCAEHGGEISRQLQELANAVSTERQNHIEGKIHALAVKATGPLFIVFAGFFILMLAGIFAKLASSLKL